MVVFCWIVAVGLGWFGWIGARADPRHPLAQLFCLTSLTGAVVYVGLNADELLGFLSERPRGSAELARMVLALLPPIAAVTAVTRLGLNLLGARSQMPDA